MVTHGMTVYDPRSPVTELQLFLQVGQKATKHGTGNNLYVQSSSSGYGNERGWLKSLDKTFSSRFSAPAFMRQPLQFAQKPSRLTACLETGRRCGRDA
jgi:hypothetical protein